MALQLIHLSNVKTDRRMQVNAWSFAQHVWSKCHWLQHWIWHIQDETKCNAGVTKEGHQQRSRDSLLTIVKWHCLQTKF